MSGARVPGCVFCDIAAGAAPATVVRRWRAPRWSARHWVEFLRGDRRRGEVIAVRPRGGVNDGHVLVIPRAHVADAGVDPAVSARTMACAAELLGEHQAANIITSRGSAATQTVFHLHIHVVPRAAGDGLPLPWTPRREATDA
ncbi:HIT family protein [Amycolatopsis sp. lyj-109]|uniref:HIT family protein n=1 Tax=Amycolatopsis sp. lyj-109 TaxID=2789287 RepID=UPI00397DC76B